MSKTFKSAVTPETHRLIIGTINDNQVLLETDSPHIVQAARIAIATAEAPALALAILEAAGIEAIPFDEGPETIPGHAVWALCHHVQELEAKAKEASDLKALERRRDELAKELECAAYGQHETGVKYIGMTATTWAAIDRIIELEDRATK